jgi:hypothetical protein
LVVGRPMFASYVHLYEGRTSLLRNKGPSNCHLKKKNTYVSAIDRLAKDTFI